MRTSKITDGDIADMKISALPTRPTAPTAFGGKGYTPTELKAAFDRLPLHIIERFNDLVDDILGTGGEGVEEAIKSGISEGHTLKDLASDIKSGDFLSYTAAPEGMLGEYLIRLREDVNTLASALGVSLA